jgi:DtxR family Mn-dependent transcriptional regulator
MSESEEMYLVTVARLIETGFPEPIPLSRLAEELSIQAISVNQMVRKLADEGYVSYLPYKGVALLPEGRRLAHYVLRCRRLWEVFLVEHLGLPPSEADALACRMEHVTPCEVGERLYAYLGQPTVSPLGRTIPKGDGLPVADHLPPLSTVQVGQRVEVVRLETELASAAFLRAEGLHPGVPVTVLAIGDQGAMLLQVGERQMTITGSVAENVMVKITNEISTDQS